MSNFHPFYSAMNICEVAETFDIHPVCQSRKCIIRCLFSQLFTYPTYCGGFFFCSYFFISYIEFKIERKKLPKTFRNASLIFAKRPSFHRSRYRLLFVYQQQDYFGVGAVEGKSQVVEQNVSLCLKTLFQSNRILYLR